MGQITPYLHEVLEYEHDEGNGFRIGLDDYPIHDPANRIVLNQLILDEYRYREIGLETVPLFIDRVRLKMRQIMPYYNQLFATEELLVGKELATFDLTTTRDDTTSENASDTGHTDTHENGATTSHGTSGAHAGQTVGSTSGARNVNSDTPEVQLSGDEDYATFLTDANSSASTTTTSDQTGTNDGTGTNTSTGSSDSTAARTIAGKLDALSRTTGFQGAASDLLTKYRATLLNINMMIVPQLGDLFLLVREIGRAHV